MSDESPPAGALRLARVAGVPVYLDRTWLFLGAFVAWTGWRNASDLGTGGALAAAAVMVLGILVAVLGHEVAHAVAARLLGFRVHRIVATLWGGHTAYDGTGTTPGRTAVVAVGGPLANLALAAMGAVATATLPWPASGFAARSLFLNLLLAGFNLLPGLPLDGGQLVQSLVWGVSGRRDLGLVVAGWCGRVLAVGVVLWYAAKPLAEGTSDCRCRAGPGHGLDPLVGRDGGPQASPTRAAAPAGAPRGRHGPGGRRAGPHPGRRAGRHRAAGGGARRAGHPPLAAARAVGDPARHRDPAAHHAAGVPRRQGAGRCVVELAPGDDAEPVLRAMATTGWGVVVVTSAGTVRGLVTSERLNAVAEAVLGRN